MVEKMLKFIMMVAIGLCLFGIIKIFTILDGLQNEIDTNNDMISGITTKLNGLDIECIKDF